MGIVVDANRRENAALSFMNSGNYARRLMAGEWQPLTEDDPPYSPEDEYLLIEADPGEYGGPDELHQDQAAGWRTR